MGMRAVNARRSGSFLHMNFSFLLTSFWLSKQPSQPPKDFVYWFVSFNNCKKHLTLQSYGWKEICIAAKQSWSNQQQSMILWYSSAVDKIWFTQKLKWRKFVTEVSCYEIFQVDRIFYFKHLYLYSISSICMLLCHMPFLLPCRHIM